MFKTLSAKAAAQLDQELMSSGAYSIDQLMELAAVKSKSWDYKLDKMDFFSFSKCLEKKTLLVDPC